MSLRLPSMPSSFIFSFPSDFITTETAQKYVGFLDAYHMQYDNIIDYLNSSIKSVTFPGLSLTPAEQHILRGKSISYKPSVPAEDLVTTNEINITFNDIDGHANYFLVYQLFLDHYLDTENLFINPFTVTTLDMWRNSVYQIKYYQLIAMSLSDMLFDCTLLSITRHS